MERVKSIWNTLFSANEYNLVQIAMRFGHLEGVKKPARTGQAKKK